MRTSTEYQRLKVWPLWLVGLGLLWMNHLAEAQEKYCLSRDSNPYLFFGTKTSYHFAHRIDTPEEIPPKCRPVQMWLLARHGTRYMGKKKLEEYYNLTRVRDEIVQAHEKFKRGELCYEDLTALKRWQPEAVKRDQQNMLTSQGYDEMDFIARRFKTLFRTLLDATYTPESFIFKFSESLRTHDSAQAFADGLFGKGAIQITDYLQDDALLTPHDNCTTMDELKKDPAYSEEAKKFLESSLMTNMAKTVNKRFGYEVPRQMDQVLKMYEACRFVKAWNISEVSPWCSGFHRDELQMLEYYEDLKKYYSSGYGNKLMQDMGCPLVKDMLANFNKIANNDMNDTRTTARGVFYFVHSVMIRALITRLGMYQDPEPLRHDNYLHLAKRQWRTSHISPFAANLAAVFFKCQGFGEDNKVMFFLNERHVKYDGCNFGLCDWSSVYEKFKPIIESESCSYEFCHKPLGGGQSALKFQFSLVPMLFLTIAVLR